MTTTATTTRPVLYAETAEDLMQPNPVSIRAHATVREAEALLTDKQISAAPVIDNAGRPVGVLSRTDLVQYEREKAEYVPPVPDYYGEGEISLGTGEILPPGFQVENADRTEVWQIMTPAVYSVAPNAPVLHVVEAMVRRKVHRLFVVDEDGTLVGVISALDVLRNLHE
jgi:CBS domain-containing protein